MIGDLSGFDLVFVHLSDIHFREGQSNDHHDLDEVQRRAIQEDLRRGKSNITTVHGLVISGDIAFQGRHSEYEIALRWISSICEVLNCREDQVLVTPGNHDINRDLVKSGAPAALHHETIRSQKTVAECDEALNKLLRSSTNSDELIAPMKAYNDFAKQFECAITAAKPYWERKFDLKSGLSIIIRGLVTTLLSGHNDDQHNGKMLYGPAQRKIIKEAKQIYTIVGHHPPNWAIDENEASKVFNQHAILQLFGHTHDQTIKREGVGVKLIAGAVNPNRRERKWNPRYYIIGISSSTAQSAKVRIFPRRWSEDYEQFVGELDGSDHDYVDHELNF